MNSVTSTLFCLIKHHSSFLGPNNVTFIQGSWYQADVLLGLHQVPWTSGGSLQRGMRPEQAALQGQASHQPRVTTRQAGTGALLHPVPEQGEQRGPLAVPRVSQKARWVPGGSAVTGQVPRSSQASDSVGYLTWAQAQPPHTSGRGLGRELELKCSSQVKQGGLQRGFPQLFLSHLLFPAIWSKVTAATPRQCWPPAQAVRPLLGECTQGPHTADLMVYLWSLVCCLQFQ